MHVFDCVADTLFVLLQNCSVFLNCVANTFFLIHYSFYCETAVYLTVLLIHNLSSTLNTFNDNMHNDNLDCLINDELLKINEWLKINKLLFNIAKYKYMTFQKTNENA